MTLLASRLLLLSGNKILLKRNTVLTVFLFCENYSLVYSILKLDFESIHKL